MYVNVLPQLILVVFRTCPCANVRMAGPAGSAPQVNVLDLEVKVYSVKKNTGYKRHRGVSRVTTYTILSVSFFFYIFS